MEEQEQTIWFRRKKYGYGWTPATWQGWVVLGIYLGGVCLFIRYLLPESNASSPIQFLIAISIWTVALLVVTYRTGESPRWQWGDDVPSSKL